MTLNPRLLHGHAGSCSGSNSQVHRRHSDLDHWQELDLRSQLALQPSRTSIVCSDTQKTNQTDPRDKPAFVHFEEKRLRARSIREMRELDGGGVLLSYGDSLQISQSFIFTLQDKSGARNLHRQG